MKTQSLKSKGRRLQQAVCAMIRKNFPSLTERDVVSTSMGKAGDDVQLSTKAVKLVPFAIEAKNVERVNVWAAYKQAAARRQKGIEPLVVIARNRQVPLVVVDAEYFFKLLSRKDK